MPWNRDRLKPQERSQVRSSSRRTNVSHPVSRSLNGRRRAWRSEKTGFIPDQVRDHASLALNPLLLAVHGRLDAARGTRIFPRHLAKGGAGGLLLLQGRQRLSQPQQGFRSLRRFVEFGRYRKKGLGGVAITLALKKALPQPVLRIRRQRIAGVFFREVAHGLFRQRIILALHVTDTEIEFVFRCRRWRQSGQGAGLPRIGISKIERFAGITPAGRTDRRFGRDRELS